MSYEEKARELFLKGYNCSQAVFFAFCDKTGMDEKTALKLASSFGGGVSRLREICGAVSGMAMVAGCLYGYDSPEAMDEKAAHYGRIQQLAAQFKEKHGSVVCRDLLGLQQEGPSDPVPEERTAAYYQKRKCLEFVGTAAAIMEQWIEKNGDL